MAAFAITQVVLDEATLFNIAVDPAYQRRGWGERCWSMSLMKSKNSASSRCGWRCEHPTLPPSRCMSVGFNEATIRRNYYPTTDGREDAIIMALPISM